MTFYPRQIVQKKILDTQYEEVFAWRYQCTKCGCTFRVVPEGVNNQQISMRVLGMAVMLYILGLSYGAVELVLSSLGIGIGKTSAYRAVQFAAKKVPGMKQKSLLSGYQTKAVGADVTSIRCNGKWGPIGISADADGLVTDDADGFKKVSDETGRSDQVCKSHVGRNTDALVDELTALIAANHDHSLETIGIPMEQAIHDLTKLKEMIHSRIPAEQPLAKTYSNLPRVN